MSEPVEDAQFAWVPPLDEEATPGDPTEVEALAGTLQTQATHLRDQIDVVR